MPPVEFDTIPRTASHSVHIVKESMGSVIEVLEVGSFKPIITRSSGISPDHSGIIEDVDVPEDSSDDETTADKIMKDYSEDSADDADYVPSENSEDDYLEYDSDASVSDEEIEAEFFTRSDGPAVIPEGSMVIEDVEIPRGSSAVIEDVPFGGADVPDTLTCMIGYAASYSIFQTGIKTLDFGLNIAETTISPFSESSKDLVQGVRRTLRAVRRSGLAKEETLPMRRSLRDLPSRTTHSHGLTGQVNWLLSFADMSLTKVSEPTIERDALEDEDFTDDYETTVYKLMKDYDSEDDMDYIPCVSSMDSMEFYSDFSDDETTVDKLMKEYSDDADSDFVPCDESEDTLEFNSDADISEDSEESSDDYSDIDSEDETTVDKIMKEYSEDSADSDYVPAEESEDELEFDSDADSDAEEKLLEIKQENITIEDVEIPLENSTGILDATTIAEFLEDYADESIDEDYLPYEESEGSLEFDSNASISEDDSESDASTSEDSDISEDVEDSQDSLKDSDQEDLVEETLEVPSVLEVSKAQPIAHVDELTEDLVNSQESEDEAIETDSSEDSDESEDKEHEPALREEGAFLAAQVVQDEIDSQEEFEVIQASEVAHDEIDSQEEFKENEEELREDESSEGGYTAEVQYSQEVERAFECGYTEEVQYSQEVEGTEDSQEEFEESQEVEGAEENEEELREDEACEGGYTAEVQYSQEVERAYECGFTPVQYSRDVEGAYECGYTPVEGAYECGFTPAVQYTREVEGAYESGFTSEVQYSQEVERAFQEEFDGFSADEVQYSQDVSEEEF